MGHACEALDVELGSTQLGAHGTEEGAALIQVVHVAPGAQELPHLLGACTLYGCLLTCHFVWEQKGHAPPEQAK